MRARVQLTDEDWEFIEPHLPIGEYGAYPKALRQQFEGVIWRFRTGGQWREMPSEFGAWSTVSNRFRQWRDAGVFEALLEDLIAEAAKRGEVDLSLVSIDSTTTRAGMVPTADTAGSDSRTVTRTRVDGPRRRGRRHQPAPGGRGDGPEVAAAIACHLHCSREGRDGPASARDGAVGLLHVRTGMRPIPACRLQRSCSCSIVLLWLRRRFRFRGRRVIILLSWRGNGV